MVPLISGQLVTYDLDQVDQGSRDHLGEALVTDVSDKEANDINIDGHDVRQLFIELIEERCKSLNDRLQSLLVESDISIVLGTFLILDR